MEKLKRMIFSKLFHLVRCNPCHKQTQKNATSIMYETPRYLSGPICFFFHPVVPFSYAFCYIQLLH